MSHHLGHRLRERDRTPFATRPICGLDQGHSPERRAPRDLRFCVVLYGPHELAHGPLEGLGEPAILPAWPLPLPVHGPGRPVDGRGAALRIVGPADRALGYALHTFDPPLDPMVGPREAV